MGRGMRDWRLVVAGLLAALLVVGLFVSTWIVVAVLLVAILTAITYAVGALGSGQREWFGREEARRASRQRRHAR